MIFCRELTFFLIVDHFKDESSHILSELNSHPKSLFLYLKTVIEVHLSGTFNFSCLREEEIVDVLSEKRGKESEKVLKAYLENLSNFPKYLRHNPLHVTDDMIELYLEVSAYRLQYLFNSMQLPHSPWCPIELHSFKSLVWHLLFVLPFIFHFVLAVFLKFLGSGFIIVRKEIAY